MLSPRGFRFGKILSRTLLAVLFVHATLPRPAWGQEIEWTRQFGTTGSDTAVAVSVDASGVYVAGFTDGAFPGQTKVTTTEAFVRKYDVSGNEVWTRQFVTGGLDNLALAQAISVGASGIYVAGFTFNLRALDVAFVHKYDLDGNELWTRLIADASAFGVSANGSGVYVVGLKSRADVFVRKYDAAGNELWTRQFGSPSLDFARGTAADASGVYVVGLTLGVLPGQASAGQGDAFVRKYDPDGNELWTRQFGSTCFVDCEESFGAPDDAFGVSLDASGVYVAGTTHGIFSGQTNAGRGDAFVRKYDANGNEVWTRQFGSSQDDIAFATAADSSGVYLAGHASGVLPGQTGAAGFDAFARKYDAAGNEVWTHQFGSSSFDFGLGISVHAAQAYVAGFTDGVLAGQSSAGNRDAFVVRFSLFSPPELLEQLIAQVVSLNLRDGISNSLDAKLEAALRALDDVNTNNNAAAIGSLQGFIQAVEGQRGVNISDADATALIAAAQHIVALLGGP